MGAAYAVCRAAKVRSAPLTRRTTLSTRSCFTDVTAPRYDPSAPYRKIPGEQRVLPHARKRNRAPTRRRAAAHAKRVRLALTE
ncbi:hypothetical protein Ade02nite_36190 [Paractinoplanes deccanensis]|uniref:Uncharacterized protein n=1 Tax=Paractinoplanes deccanensis TaxID=113561 RepID=A0ABQ3Y4R7_9ACTN|nr:hypothetical protein Ade02nite_36190 [Actinoplanes deccanensis]